MRAGDLRQRITIQISQRTKNSMGEWYDTWATWATVWGELQPLSGRKYMEAKQANADVSGICRIRYKNGLLPTMRLSYEGRILGIVSIVSPKEAKDETQIYYREKLD